VVQQVQHLPGNDHVGQTLLSGQEPDPRIIASPDPKLSCFVGLRFIKLSILQMLFCTDRFISRLDLRLLVQNHVQQGFMDFDCSIVFDETQLAEFVHEKTYP
jgi:hypothetical protein